MIAMLVYIRKHCRKTFQAIAQFSIAFELCSCFELFIECSCRVFFIVKTAPCLSSPNVYDYVIKCTNIYYINNTFMYVPYNFFFNLYFLFFHVYGWVGG